MVFFVLFGVRNFGNYICHSLYSWEYRLWLQGFGDVFVFVFFGLVSTLGVIFYTQTIGFRIGFACQ
jgi:1,4-dihydroxy-2-naphthoate octaprenyltransferase